MKHFSGKIIHVVEGFELTREELPKITFCANCDRPCTPAYLGKESFCNSGCYHAFRKKEREKLK